MYFTARPKDNRNILPWDEMTVDDLRYDADRDFPRNNKLSERDRFCFTCPLPECTPMVGDYPLRAGGLIAG